METKTKISVRMGDWRAVWEGGMYADVFHASKRDALDVINMEDEAESGQALRSRLAACLAEWITDYGDTFKRELPYL